MATDTVVVATFTNQPEAEAMRERLASLGITAEIRRDNVGGMYPQLDIQEGIDLVVASETADAARQAIADLQTETAGPPWTCPACGEEVGGNFTACWNCGRERG